jgi:hypothetical protein
VNIFDHQKTWRFKLKAKPPECLVAFRDAFSGGVHLMQAKWDVSISGTTATAEYQGRAGLMKGLTMLSRRATSEEDRAIGSTVTFEVEDVADDGTATCAMWLSANSTIVGFTADGRFFRPYMRAVTDQLTKVDPSVQIQKA